MLRDDFDRLGVVEVCPERKLLRNRKPGRIDFLQSLEIGLKSG